MSDHHWDEGYLDQIISGTAAEAESLVATVETAADGPDHRRLMRSVLILASHGGVRELGAALDWPVAQAPAAPDAEQTYEAALAYLGALEAIQGPDGLFSSEGNLHSPPDSSFTINDLSIAVHLLDAVRAAAGARPGWDEIRERLRRIGARASSALKRGGVHTPNHRWELASALGGLATVLPEAEGLRERAQEWLAEGIDIDADGLYSERSAIYAAEVSNPSLISLARDLPRPELLDVVRRNLAAIVPLVEDDGEVENVHSRRQDQRLGFDAEYFLVQLRTFALSDGDGDLARVARAILERGLQEPGRVLAHTMREPELAHVLPASTQPAESWDRHYPHSNLLRMRRGPVTASIFAGSDFSRTRRIASGLANSATLLKLRTGQVKLASVRVVPEFFSMGYLRPQRLDLRPDGAVLTEQRTSGYYGPRSAGTDLGEPENEGRYFAAMDFGSRELDALSLTSQVAIDVDPTGATLDLSFEGVTTTYTVELVFEPGLDVTGAALAEDGSWWSGGHVDDGGVLSVSVSRGAGQDPVAQVRASGVDGEVPHIDEGEMFGYVGGNDGVDGTRVLLTGRTDRPAKVRIELA